MSYILDALRRADAERERGAVPSIHAQQFGQLPTEDEPERAPRRLLWIVAALASVLVALVAWVLLGRDPRATGAVPIAATTPAAPPAATVGTPQPMPAAGVPAPVAIAPAVTSPRPAIAIESHSAAPKAARRPVHAAPPTALARPAEAATAAAERTPAKAPAREAPDPAKVYSQRDLPPEIRSGMPTLTINGSTYSSDQSSRMLMIGGQIFHEGDAVVGGVVVREIKRRAAVFAYRGYLYEIAF